MSKGLRRCIRKKNKLYKLSLSRKETVMIDKYKKYKDILTKCLRTAEENYFKSILNEKANAVLRMWAILGPMLNPSKKRTPCNKAKLLDESKRTITSNKDIANTLNNYFCSVGNMISSKVDTTDVPFSHFLKNQNERSFFLKKNYQTRSSQRNQSPQTWQSGRS